ncbi:MAG: cation:proton antiporter [Candidatus Symbiothrix sp.]|jgi:CPA2 family monovalent cation:H+ antiporter-2|nr:cation:proton antiporter [Candidatus Symbiothrix sp.]
MSELSPLIVDLAIILVVASACSLLFKWLKQPVVLAYIVAGIISTFIIPQHGAEHENIETWAEIGIIFLLFGLGLEFSFKKLMKVGATAFISTIFVVVSMIGLGYLTGLSFGWSHLSSLFLGAMLCMSSTMIIIKVFEDLHLTKKNFAGIVLGMLIIEDLVAVLLMVLLSTIGVSRQFQGTEMLVSLFKLTAFLLFWFVLGTFLIPTVLRTMKRFLNDETLLIMALAFCMGMVYLATKAGFSAALGAFIMGSILAETLDAERIDKMIMPIKNFFGAIFFVSVGMMIQLSSLGDNIVPILIISVVVIVGQMIFATVGILLAGQNLQTAVSAGFSLTQIGEFSYIIAGLGMSLGVIENSLYQIIVSASVLTIFATPYMMKLSTPVYGFLERTLPEKWQKYLNRDISIARPVNQKTVWKSFLKKMLMRSLLYTLLCVIIIYFSLELGSPYLQLWLPGWKGNALAAIVILGLISPFLRAIIIQQDHSVEFLHLWKTNKVYRGHLLFTIILRILISCALIMYVLLRLFHTNLVIALSLALILLFLFMASRHLQRHTQRLERRFTNNFNEKEAFEASQKPVTQGFANHLLERDLHLSEFVIEPNYSIIGKTLKELKFRQLFGVNIVTIVRGDIRINIPNGDERIYPNDRIVVFGTDKQIDLFEQRIEEKKQKYAEYERKPVQDVVLQQLEIEADSPLAGKNLRTSHIQDDYDLMVIGIERNNTSLLNPGLDLEFEQGDILWIIGEIANINRLRELCK